MGLPHSLAGIIGFILVVGYMTSLVMENNNETTETEQLINNMKNTTQRSLNASESSSGMSGFFTQLGGVIDIIWSMFGIIYSSLAAFLLIPVEQNLPVELYLFFAIIFVSAIIAILKVIWSGE